MSDRRERSGDLYEALSVVVESKLREVWTALPGFIDAYDPSTQTATVRTTVKAEVVGEDGASTWVDLPQLIHCPVLFSSGGGFTLTFPLVAGDECLVVFSSRCIDGWWQSSGSQQPPDGRTHDLSDGFVLPGVRSQPKRLPVAPVTDGVELRNDARTAVVKINSSGVVSVNTNNNVTVAAAQVQVTAGTITLTGNVNVVGNLTVSGTMTNAGKDVGATHRNILPGALSTETGVVL